MQNGGQSTDMKKNTGSFLAKAALIAASAAAAGALLLKLKKDNDLLTSYENEEDDNNDFGEIDNLDSINKDDATREYVSIKITDSENS